ncbi:MAG: nucleotidyltransferase substrate binding protein [Candidatus Eisenbacteria bacterium]
MHDVRWRQRFQNFDRAVRLLREPLARDVASLNALEKEGTVQRFEFALELGWKTIKDYLEHEGHLIQPVTPRNVIKLAFSTGVIVDGQVWIDMLNHRNLLAHTYDETAFEEAVHALCNRYHPAIEDLHAWFSARLGS